MSEPSGASDDGAPGERGDKILDRVVTALTAAAALGVVLVIFHVDYLPTADGPHHLFQGYLENHFSDPGSGFLSWLDRGSPFTALGFHLVFSTFERLLGWRRAFQVTLAVLALGWGGGFLLLARAIHPRRAALGMLGMATAISWSVYLGFFSFAMSVALGFAVIAVAVAPGRLPWTWQRRGCLAALLLMQAVVHAFGAELTGLVLVILVAVSAAPTSRARARAREIGLLGLMGVPAMLIALTAASNESNPTTWLSLADHFRVLPRTFLPGPPWRAWTPILLSLAGIALAVRRRRRGALSPPEIALAGAAALFLVLSFTAPIDLASWELFAPRFLPFGCLLGAALLPLERLALRGRAAAVAGLALFTGASLLWAARTASALRAGEDESLSGLAAPLHRKGPRLAVSIDAFAAQRDSAHLEIPYDAPIFSMGPLYAMAQGGIPPCCFLNNPRLHSFVLAPEAASRFPPLFNPADFLDPRIQSDPAVRAEHLSLLATVGASYEDVIIDGRPEDRELFVRRGYAVDFQQGGLFIGHLEGCPLTVQVVTPAPRRAPVFLDFGAEPYGRILTHAVLPPEPARPGSEARTEVPIPKSLCGPMWLRVALDRDGSGSASKADAFCAGADARGRLLLDLSDRGGQTVVCSITP